MLIDDITIKIKAGDGGDGAVAFNKNMMSLGPAGGDGGNGGNVYFEGVSDLNALGQFRNKKKLVADDGGHGRKQFSDGADGEDLISKVPVGTVIRILDMGPPGLSLQSDRVGALGEAGEVKEIIKIGERVLVARGGRGGKGNFKFRSATNTSPKEFQEGTPGEAFTIRLELKLIADVGLVGLPNAGKSSLLNELTNAKSKVANYPFTTLEPNLGVYYELILADIPGLIEGASSGKGLGVIFLQHIERTKTIFHLISAESENPAAYYSIIRKELSDYNEELALKPEYVFLSKSDMISEGSLDDKMSALKKIGVIAAAISIHDESSINKVKEILNGIKAKNFEI